MEHEALVVLARDVLDLLLVVRGAECAGDQCLCFAAREDHGAVDAREDAGFGPDRPDLVELASVEPDVAIEHLFAQHLLFQFVEDVLGFGFLGGQRLVGRQLGDECAEHVVDAAVVLELVLDAHRGGKGAQHLRFGGSVERLVSGLDLDHQLLPSSNGLELVDAGDDLLDRGVGGFERPHDLRFRHFLGAGFHHHDAFAAAGDDQV